jgi:hypothetical protein
VTYLDKAETYTYQDERKAFAAYTFVCLDGF